MTPINFRAYRRSRVEAQLLRAEDRREKTLLEELELTRQQLEQAQEETARLRGEQTALKLQVAQEEAEYLRGENARLRARMTHLRRRKQRKPTPASFEKYRRQCQKRDSAAFLRRTYGLRLSRERAWRFRKD